MSSQEARIDFVNGVLDGTVNSIVQYIKVAAPYIPPECEEDMETLRRLRDEEAEQSQELYAIVSSLDGVPKVGAFPYWNIDLNYLDVRFLADFAARHQEKVIERTRRGLDVLRQSPKAHAAVSRVLEQKRAHLVELRAIAAKRQPAKEDAESETGGSE